MGTFTKSEITGAKIGQAVEYHVVVKNNGNVALKFGTLTDANCELITGGASELAPGAETTFSCTHTLAAVGPYSNEASIEGNEGAGTKTSNKVTVSVTEEAGYTIEKLQRDPGRSQLHQKRSHRQNRPDGRIRDRRQEHRQRGAQIRRPERRQLRRRLPVRADRTRARAPKRPSPAPTCSATPAPTPTKPRSKAANGTGTKTSNPVTAKSASAPSFTVEKRQRLGGAGSVHDRHAQGEARRDGRIPGDRQEHRQPAAQIHAR